MSARPAPTRGRSRKHALREHARDEHSLGARAFLFARNAVRHPRMLGAVAPSSPYLVARMLAPVGIEHARVLVEYGPGLGAVTAAILRRMRPDAQLIAFETNAEFAGYLRTHLPDPRLHVAHAPAEEAPCVLARFGLPAADGVVSSLPLTLMPADVRRRVLVGARAVLAPGAPLALYQYTRAVLPELRAVFGPVRQAFEVRNLPPAWVFWCRAP